MIRVLAVVAVLLLGGLAGMAASSPSATTWEPESTANVSGESVRGGCEVTADAEVADGEHVVVYQHADSVPAGGVATSKVLTDDGTTTSVGYPVLNVTVLAVDVSSEHAATLATGEVKHDCSVGSRGEP